jgi:hypothetical protein
MHQEMGVTVRVEARWELKRSKILAQIRMKDKD